MTLKTRIQWARGRWRCWWKGEHTLRGLETHAGVDATGTKLQIFEISIGEQSYCKFCKKHAFKLFESSIQEGQIPEIQERS